MISGVKITLGARDYIVPPLNFRSIRALAPDIEGMMAVDLAAGSTAFTVALERIARVVHAAVSRNYPDVTLEEIEDGLDMRNKDQVTAAIFGASGFETVTVGEAGAPPASADQSTGTTSTPSSPSSSTGASSTSTST